MGTRCFPYEAKCSQNSSTDPSTQELAEISGANYSYIFPTLSKRALLFLRNYSYKQTTVSSAIKTYMEKY